MINDNKIKEDMLRQYTQFLFANGYLNANIFEMPSPILEFINSSDNNEIYLNITISELSIIIDAIYNYKLQISGNIKLRATEKALELVLSKLYK